MCGGEPRCTADLITGRAIRYDGCGGEKQSRSELMKIMGFSQLDYEYTAR